MRRAWMLWGEQAGESDLRLAWIALMRQIAVEDLAAVARELKECGIDPQLDDNYDLKKD